MVDTKLYLNKVNRNLGQSHNVILMTHVGHAFGETQRAVHLSHFRCEESLPSL